MFGYEKVRGLDWPVMWKKDPCVKRLREVWLRALTSGRGLDTTSRSLKACISGEMCKVKGRELSNEMLFAGYVSGSTLGSASLCLAWMLMEISQRSSPWQIPEVQAFVRSISRIKAVFVVYDSPVDRAADAWRTLAILSSVFVAALPSRRLPRRRHPRLPPPSAGRKGAKRSV